jgi:hypothetical protein
MPPTAAHLDALLEAADFDRLGVLAHRLQETSVSSGQPVLLEIGTAVELAAAGGDVLALLTAIDDLRDYLADGDSSPIAA